MKKSFKEINLPSDLEYRTDEKHKPIEFYVSTFPHAKRIDIHLGYFSSNSIILLSSAFAQFIYFGGTMRLIVNHVLSERDIELIDGSEITNEDLVKRTLLDLESLKDELKKGGQHFFDCLKYLIKDNRLEIVPVTTKRGNLSHNKNILLEDNEGNYLYTEGSGNLTFNGIAVNGESTRVDTSWGAMAEKSRIEKATKRFNQLFEKNHPEYVYLESDDIEVVVKDIGNDKDKNELLDDGSNLLKDLVKTDKDQTIIKAEEDLNNLIHKIKTEPKFPFPSGPREYQKEAYEAWVKNDKKGIFAMATGTGKTLTSLNCVLNEFRNSNYKIYRSLVLVPTIALVDQWTIEFEKFNFSKNIIKVSSKTNWREDLARIQALSSLGNEESYMIVSTYASFVKKGFQDEFKKLHKDTILIADETHNIGAPSILKLLKDTHLNMRIGLSATPERQFGDKENEAINDFYSENPKEEGYTYEYSMEDAIKKEPKALCPYRYYPKIVELTDEEFLKYNHISKQIVRLQEPRSKENQKLFEILALKRQRIIHKAENKIDVFKDILEIEFKKRGNLKYTLIYTPEGIPEDGVINKRNNSDDYIETDEDQSLINLFTREVSKMGKRTPVKQFTGKTNLDDRKKILYDFSNGKTEVITSMKCLDEGVDIPRSELAIFCSSTGNPRQFIQRRGRVLRKHDDKKEAIIYDLIVVPKVTGTEELYKTEKNQISKEIKRVRDFAELSENYYEALSVLSPLLKYYNLNL